MEAAISKIEKSGAVVVRSVPFPSMDQLVLDGDDARGTQSYDINPCISFDIRTLYLNVKPDPLVFECQMRPPGIRIQKYYSTKKKKHCMKGLFATSTL